MRQGIEQGLIKSVQKMLTKGYSCEEVSDILEMDIEEVRAIQEELRLPACVVLFKYLVYHRNDPHLHKGGKSSPQMFFSDRNLKREV